MNDKIAIYLRLSLADGDLKKGSKDESNSIENQRMLLHDYIGKQEDLFGEIVEYVDDGYSYPVSVRSGNSQCAGILQ